MSTDDTGDELYAAPKADSAVEAAQDGLQRASQGQRLANLIIDRVAIYALGVVFVGPLIVLAEPTDPLSDGVATVIGAVITFGYYGLLEFYTQRTLGKLITGTKVVNDEGGRPSFGQVVGRTFVRLVPFDALSYLGPRVYGWHDRFTGTRVVRTR